MGKTKTSRKRKDFSFEDMPIIKLKPGVKTYPHDPSESFKKHDEVLAALFECLKDGDAESFKDILSAYVRVNRAASSIARKSKIPLRTIQHALSKKGNPTLDKMAKIMKHAFQPT